MMKKFLGILALGLLLVGCVQSEKRLTNKKNAKIFKFNATSIIDKKQDSWLWFGIHKGAYYGFGNTPKEASDNATKICEEIRKKKFANELLYCLEPMIFYGRKHIGTISKLDEAKIKKIENKKKLKKLK